MKQSLLQAMKEKINGLQSDDNASAKFVADVSRQSMQEFLSDELVAEFEEEEYEQLKRIKRMLLKVSEDR